MYICPIDLTQKEPREMETYDDLIETIIESYQKAQAEIGQCSAIRSSLTWATTER